MEALLTSTLSVAIAEIGDKTQLLALLLICRFRKPWPIVLGIFVATLVNHIAMQWEQQAFQTPAMAAQLPKPMTD